MRRGAAAAIAVAGLAVAAPAAAGGPPERPEAVAIGRTWVHACPGGPEIVAEVAPDWVRLFLPAGPVRLPAAVSASGARYTDGVRTYWSKGREALIETGAGSWTGCAGREIADPWQAARLRDVDLRAVGQEPGWVLELRRGGRTIALLDYGERVLDLPALAPELGGDGTVLSCESAGRRVIVRPVETGCRDTMSGRRFPMTVELTVGARPGADAACASIEARRPTAPTQSRTGSSCFETPAEPVLGPRKARTGGPAPWSL